MPCKNGVSRNKHGTAGGERRAGRGLSWVQERAHLWTIRGGREKEEQGAKNRSLAGENGKRPISQSGEVRGSRARGTRVLWLPFLRQKIPPEAGYPTRGVHGDVPE